MTQKESDLILLGALRHTSGTRANYLITESQKAGISDEMLLAELENSYQRLYKIVTLPKSDEWGVNNDGSIELQYPWVKLYNLGIPDFLHKDNISELQDIINDFRRHLTKDAPVKDQAPMKKHPEKWYALYHMILIAIGEQVPNFAESSKAEIINYGSEKHGTGQTFYTELKKIDLNSLRDYIGNMTIKDRKSWKNIITDISKNNAEIITWLSKQPN